MAALAEPLRRELYEYVVRSPAPVGRDEAARAVGISRPLAAFHLDRLVEVGLLDTEFARLTGRTGPGAGRPAKLYRRSARSVALSIPPRDYELPARLLADVVSGPSPSPQAAMARAREAGLALGEDVRRRAGGRGRTRALAALRETLADRGFDPRPDGREGLRLGNCPFDSLAREHRDLMCGMNHAMMDGVVEGLGTPGLEALVDPQEGSCCVAFRRPRGPRRTAEATS